MKSQFISIITACDQLKFKSKKNNHELKSTQRIEKEKKCVLFVVQFELQLNEFVTLFIKNKENYNEAWKKKKLNETMIESFHSDNKF